MKLGKIIVIIFISIFAFNLSAKAQFGYKNEYKTIEGIQISYKWSHSQWWKKESPLQLRFKIKNTNNYKVSSKFELVYMLDHVVKFQSGELESEIKSGKSLIGKINGFYFETKKLKNSEILSDDFEWDFLSFEVSKL